MAHMTRIDRLYLTGLIGLVVLMFLITALMVTTPARAQGMDATLQGLLMQQQYEAIQRESQRSLQQSQGFMNQEMLRQQMDADRYERQHRQFETDQRQKQQDWRQLHLDNERSTREFEMYNDRMDQRYRQALRDQQEQFAAERQAQQREFDAANAFADQLIREQRARELRDGQELTPCVGLPVCSTMKGQVEQRTQLEMECYRGHDPGYCAALTKKGVFDNGGAEWRALLRKQAADRQQYEREARVNRQRYERKQAADTHQYEREQAAHSYSSPTCYGPVAVCDEIKKNGTFDTMRGK